MRCNDIWSSRLQDFLDKVDLEALARRTGDVLQQPSCQVSENFTRGSFALVFEIVRNTLGVTFSSPKLTQL
jgi:hypothetical protein